MDVRALHPDSSLADLYNPLTIPIELRKAHTANDKAVMAAYGFYVKMTETDCAAVLMRMYQVLSNNKELKIDITVREYSKREDIPPKLENLLFLITRTYVRNCWANSFVKAYVIR